MLIVIAVLLLTGLKPGMAQNFKEAIENMQQVYASAENLHIEMQVKVFDQPTDAEPFYQLPVEIIKVGENFNYRYGTNQMITTNEAQLLIDHDKKQIIYSKLSDNATNQSVELPSLGLDSLLSFYQKPEYLGKEEQTNHYRLEQKDGGIDQVDLYINTASKLLDKMEYRYRSGQFVSIRFTRFETQAIDNGKQFSLSDFVQKEGTKYLGVGAYAQYQVISQ